MAKLEEMWGNRLERHEHGIQLGITPIPGALGDMLLTIQFACTVATIAQYLSPYPVIRKIVKQNTTGNFSYVPYLANFLNATLTAVYGFLLRDRFMMLLNSFCFFVAGTYLIMYQVLAKFSEVSVQVQLCSKVNMH